ncbi:MAG: DNA topoisomerase [Butyricicoccus sp.]
MFRASGHTVAFPGFTAVYEEGTDDEKKQDSAGKPLPRFDQGDKLTAEKIEPSQHFTQPPARYTEASLIRAMEERGIGRPSTYAPTISTIIDRDYVTKENKALRPTPLGEGVTGLLVDEFKSVADYEFTANMEHELDEVEAGKLNYIQLLHNFYDGFEAALKQAEIDLEGKRIKIQDEVTDVICEKCGRNMVIKSGRFGKFLACPGFPECTNTKPITEDTGAACPVCGAKVVKKKSARGYVYYSCDTYPTCQFMTWDKPLKTKCPNCDSSLFRHTDRDSKEVTDVCLREGCGYKELVKEGLPPEETEKRRKMREARAAKAAERAAAKEAAEKNGETEEKVKKATKKAAVKKSTAKKTLPWMTKTTNKFKKLKDEAVQELTAKQQEQYAKALAKYEAEKAAEKAKKAAEKKAAAKKPAAKKKTTAKESAE